MKKPALNEALEKELQAIRDGIVTLSTSSLGDKGDNPDLEHWRMIKRTKMHIDTIRQFWGEPPKEFYDNNF